MPQTIVHLATLLSPVLYETYEYIACYLGKRLGLSTHLYTAREPDIFARGEAEIGLLCGLLYVHMRRASSCPVELLAAPVLQGTRYQDAPRYFSDVVVLRDHPCATFEDLRGCIWAFNERTSHSGYNLIYYTLLQRGLGLDFFGQTSETGSHLQSLRAVLDGVADATALDSHVFDVLCQQQPELGDRLRVIDAPGPSPIPPLVIARHLAPDLKLRIRQALLTMHHDPQAVRELGKGRIKRFVPIADEDYDPLREMFAQVQRYTAVMPER